MSAGFSTETDLQLPGLDCGACGFRTCDEFRGAVWQRPELMQRCIHRDVAVKRDELPSAAVSSSPCAVCAQQAPSGNGEWCDSLGREFDFYLEHFPEEPGPRETILPHNPSLTREMNVQRGDLLIGRPLGMSCGCPITHCGVVMDADLRTGVMTWCVTGPLRVRESGFKDLGYYVAEAYDGLVRHSRCDLRIGMRYFFQPRMCMLQWRHSGLVNFLNRTPDGLQVRVEGLWIG